MRLQSIQWALAVALTGACVQPEEDPPKADSPVVDSDLVDTEDAPDTDVVPVEPLPCDVVAGFCEQAAVRGLAAGAEHGRGLMVWDANGDDQLDVFDCGGGVDSAGPDQSRYYQAAGDGTWAVVDLGIDPAHTHDCWGTSSADYDGDGDPDLLIAQGGYLGVGGLRLYRNDLSDGGLFVDVSVAAGFSTISRGWWGSAWADYDLDGCTDVAAVARTGRPVLYRNQCDGSFANVAAAVGIDIIFASDPSDPQGGDDGKAPLWLDHDQDGDPDLYVGGFAGKHAFFVNEGGSFRDATTEVLQPEGFLEADDDEPAFSFVSVSADFDQDGWPDLYLGRQGRQDQLLMNQHDGTLLAMGPETGIDLGALAEEGTDENTTGLGIGDIDLNGYPDLVIGTGHADAATGFPDVVFCNQGPTDGVPRFRRCSEAFAAGREPQRTTGIVVADLTRNGLPDVMFNAGGDPYGEVISQIDSAEPNHLYAGQANVGTPRSATLVLHGTGSNPDALGARVSVPGSLTRFRTVSSAMGSQSSNGPHQLVAWTAGATIEVTIRWPSGVEQIVTLAAAELLHVYEP